MRGQFTDALREMLPDDIIAPPRALKKRPSGAKKTRPRSAPNVIRSRESELASAVSLPRPDSALKKPTRKRSSSPHRPDSALKKPIRQRSSSPHRPDSALKKATGKRSTSPPRPDSAQRKSSTKALARKTEYDNGNNRQHSLPRRPMSAPHGGTNHHLRDDANLQRRKCSAPSAPIADITHQQMLNYILLAKESKERVKLGKSASSPLEVRAGSFSMGGKMPKPRPLSTQPDVDLSDNELLLPQPRKKNHLMMRPHTAGTYSPTRRDMATSQSKFVTRKRSVGALPELSKEDRDWISTTLASTPKLDLNFLMDLPIREDWANTMPRIIAQDSDQDTTQQTVDIGKQFRANSPAPVSRSQSKTMTQKPSPGREAPPMVQRKPTFKEQPMTRKLARGSFIEFTEMASRAEPDTVVDKDIRSHRNRILKRLRGGDTGFEEEDLERMRGAFMRHIFPGTYEVHVDDLMELLHHLGYSILSVEHVHQICGELALLNTLEFDEFCGFMAKYIALERQELKAAFESCDLDGNGQLSVDELEPLCTYLGITPMRQALWESLKVVDSDCSGDIDSAEFMDLISLLRATEGFSCEEMTRLRRIFDRFARKIDNHLQLGSPRLVEALTHMFGRQASDLASKMVQGITVQTTESKKITSRRLDMKGMLRFQDFLVWARCYREIELSDYKIHFRNYDSDKSGRIDRAELEGMLVTLGFTPMRSVIDGLLLEISGSTEGSIDFDDFLRLMDIFHLKDGFIEKEIETFRSSFLEYADPTTLETSCLDLLHLVRHLGFAPKLSEIHKFIDEVDFDASQTIDFREFLRLVRLLYEEEIQRAKNAFATFSVQAGSVGVLSSQSLRAAMLATDVRWSKLPRETFASLLKDRGNPEILSFEDFIEITQTGRGILAHETRRQAGFSSKELEQFKELFATYDKDKNGTIERSELVSLLKDLHIPMRNFSDQRKMLEMLREAGKSARDAGLEPDDARTDDSSPQVSFWMLVYFLRALCNKDEKKKEELENIAAQETGFSHHEVTEFRCVFEHWVDMEASTTPGLLGKRSANTPKDLLGAATENNQNELNTPLTINGLSRLLRSLECALTLTLLSQLETKVNSLDPKGCGELDFPNFLRLMKWVTTTNFADINSKVANASVVWNANDMETWAKATSNAARKAVESGSELQQCIAMIDARYKEVVPSIPPELLEAAEEKAKEIRATMTSLYSRRASKS